jgi:hypothetical protein
MAVKCRNCPYSYRASVIRQYRETYTPSGTHLIPLIILVIAGVLVFTGYTSLGLILVALGIITNIVLNVANRKERLVNVYRCEVCGCEFT